jgi:hypothetical protein
MAQSEQKTRRCERILASYIGAHSFRKFTVSPKAKVRFNEYQRLSVSLCLKCERRQKKRPMNGLCHIVRRRGPFARIDADWWRDFNPGDTNPAREC